MIETFFKLCIGHAVADYALQSESMRSAKGWTNQIKSGPVLVWPYALTAHAAIHAGTVWFITGVWWLALAEFICHWCIDFGKCSGWYQVHADQGMHIGCKVAWTVLS